MNIEEAEKYLRGYAKELAELIQPRETGFEELIHFFGRYAKTRDELSLETVEQLDGQDLTLWTEHHGQHALVLLGHGPIPSVKLIAAELTNAGECLFNFEDRCATDLKRGAKKIYPMKSGHLSLPNSVISPYPIALLSGVT